MATAVDALLTLLSKPGTIKSSGSGSFVLTANDISRLRAANHLDGTAAASAACMTYAEALAAIDGHRYSWATVKLYYCLYYSIRAYLCYSDEIHFYISRKPRWIHLRQGETIKNGKGTSHEMALDRFRTRFPQHEILSQNVLADNPLTWLKDQREATQYLREPFVDPALPDKFRGYISGKPRRMIDFYLSVAYTSSEFATLFDPQHALVALPLRLLAELLNVARGSYNFRLSEEQSQQCRSVCRADGKPIAAFNKLVAPN
jgi:hypothetical protein